MGGRRVCRRGKTEEGKEGETERARGRIGGNHGRGRASHARRAKGRSFHSHRRGSHRVTARRNEAEKAALVRTEVRRQLRLAVAAFVQFQSVRLLSSARPKPASPLEYYS